MFVIEAKTNYKGKKNIKFEQVIDRNCGLGVHCDTVLTTVLGRGIKAKNMIFGTTTSSLNELGVWLESINVADGAMESTVFTGRLSCTFYLLIR